MDSYRPKAIDLFCGVGGMSLGFEQAGFNVVAAFDAEEFNIRSHSNNFPETKAVVADLSKCSGDDLRKHASLGRANVDVVFGGPPCQGFSFGGRQDMEDERNQLVYDFARLVRQLMPTYFVMENVKGLMSSKAKPILKSFVRRVKLAGYRVVEPIRVLNAADFGVPQRRWRTFVLGYRKDAVPIEYPEPRGCIDDVGREFQPVVHDALCDLPVLEEYHELFETDTYSGTLETPMTPYARLMRAIITDPYDKSSPRINGQGLTGCLRTRHSNETVRRFAQTIPGESEPISRYIRLDWNNVSPTIRAGTGVERGSHTAPRPIHPTVPRCISSREAARLHSIPDWFHFHGTRWHDFRQIGNSVPPLLARAVAGQIAKHFYTAEDT